MKRSLKKLLTLVTAAGCFCAVSALTVCAEGTAAPAAATEAAKKATGSKYGWLIWVIYIAFIVIVGYLLIFRPNKKRKAEEEKLRSSLMLGDQIVTIGGICGTIVNIKDDTITLETSLDRTLMEFKNWAIREVKKPEGAESTEKK